MRQIQGYFVCVDGAIWTLFDDGTSNHHHDLRVTSDGKTVQFLGEYEADGDSAGGRLIVDEFPLWRSLLDLSAHIEAEVGGASLEALRADLTHQLSIPDELDWSYLLSTAARALVQADRTARNMKFGEEAKIAYDNRPNEFGSHYLPLLSPTL